MIYGQNFNQNKCIFILNFIYLIYFIGKFRNYLLDIERLK
jgi:hypothetical protein